MAKGEETLKRGLPWRKHDPTAIVMDGDQFLAAVPIAPRGYDYSVVTVHCGPTKGDFGVTEKGEHWEWCWDQIEWILPITPPASHG